MAKLRKNSEGSRKNKHSHIKEPPLGGGGQAIRLSDDCSVGNFDYNVFDIFKALKGKKPYNLSCSAETKLSFRIKGTTQRYKTYLKVMFQAFLK